MTFDAAPQTDWRWIDLAARCLADDDLAARYAADPRSVLADHGMELAAGEPAPVLPAPIAITDLTFDAALRVDAYVAACHHCGISAGRTS